MALVRLINSTFGRILRIAVGAAMIAAGLLALEGPGGIAVATAGALP